MAKKNKDQAEDQVEVEATAQETTSEGAPADEAGPVDESVGDEEVKPADEVRVDDEVKPAAEEAVESNLAAPSVLPTGIHERLEDAELAAMSGHPDVAHALNRVTLLTGALKNALPNAIEHMADDALRADLETLLGLL